MPKDYTALFKENEKAFNDLAKEACTELLETPAFPDAAARVATLARKFDSLLISVLGDDPPKPVGNDDKQSLAAIVQANIKRFEIRNREEAQAHRAAVAMLEAYENPSDTTLTNAAQNDAKLMGAFLTIFTNIYKEIDDANQIFETKMTKINASVTAENIALAAAQAAYSDARTHYETVRKQFDEAAFKMLSKEHPDYSTFEQQRKLIAAFEDEKGVINLDESSKELLKDPENYEKTKREYRDNLDTTAQTINDLENQKANLSDLKNDLVAKAAAIKEKQKSYTAAMNASTPASRDAKAAHKETVDELMKPPARFLTGVTATNLVIAVELDLLDAKRNLKRLREETSSRDQEQQRKITRVEETLERSPTITKKISDEIESIRENQWVLTEKPEIIEYARQVSEKDCRDYAKSDSDRKDIIRAKTNELTKLAAMQNENPSQKKALKILKAKLEYRRELYEIRNQSGKQYKNIISSIFSSPNHSAAQKFKATESMIAAINAELKKERPDVIDIKQFGPAAQQGELLKLSKELESINGDIQKNTLNSNTPKIS